MQQQQQQQQQQQHPQGKLHGREDAVHHVIAEGRCSPGPNELASETAYSWSCSTIQDRHLAVPGTTSVEVAGATLCA